MTRAASGGPPMPRQPFDRSVSASEVPPEVAAKLLTGQRDLLAQVLQDLPLDEVLVGLVQLIERIDDSGLRASIMLVEGDPGQVPYLRLAAAPSLPVRYREAMDGCLVEEGVSPCGTAVSRRRPVAIADVRTDPMWEALLPLCDAAGVRAWWSAPLLSGHEVLGCLTVHFPEPRPADAEQLDRLMGAGRIASIAIERERSQLARAAADDAALRLDLAQDAARVGLWDWDLASGRLIWDTHCAALFGTTLEEFEGDLVGFDRRTHPEDRDRVHQLLDRCIAASTGFEAEYRTLWADGTVRHLLSRGRPVSGEAGVERLLGAVVDVTELREAVDSERLGARTLAGLAEVALELAAAETVAQLTTTALDRGLRVLGADGGAVCVRDDERRTITLSITDSLGQQAVLDYAELDQDNPLPAIVTAMTGRRLLLPDRAACLAVTPAMDQVIATIGRSRWATLPLRAGSRLLGSLAVSWTSEGEFTDRETELLVAFAAQFSQALDRVRTLEAERRAAAAAQWMSEALQRSLLTQPPQPDDVTIAVRYAPAAHEAQVGGDWYDAFVTKLGITSLVIGDVTGHDRDAAAGMGQVRNLLRATAYLIGTPPAAALGELEQTMAGLGVQALATCVLAQVHQTPELKARGLRRLVWSSAGHLPPLVLVPGSGAQVLEQESDLLLGFDLASERTDNEMLLPAGSTVLLYTDGLVERRGEHLDVGIDRLRVDLQSLGHLPIEKLLDALLERHTADGVAEDDIAVLAVRLR